MCGGSLNSSHNNTLLALSVHNDALLAIFGRSGPCASPSPIPPPGPPPHPPPPTPRSHISNPPPPAARRPPPGQADAHKILAAYADGLVQSWDVATGESQYEVHGRTAQVHTACPI